MITDPLEIQFNEKRQKYYVKQGNETFYDPETNSWILFDTEEDAKTWIYGYRIGMGYILSRIQFKNEHSDIP